MTPTPIAALAATLDIEAPPPRAGDAVPPLWHWLYFLSIRRQSELGRRRTREAGDFLPPIPLPRRMWAGGRFEFRRPLRVGETYTRTSRIVGRTAQGRAQRHAWCSYSCGTRSETLRASRSARNRIWFIAPNAKPGDPAAAPRPAPAGAAWERVVQPDDVLLFRYSALTFNGHRIHYDRGSRPKPKAIRGWWCTGR